LRPHHEPEQPDFMDGFADGHGALSGVIDYTDSNPRLPNAFYRLVH
jgi:hypothetical protein